MICVRQLVPGLVFRNTADWDNVTNLCHRYFSLFLFFFFFSRSPIVIVFNSNAPNGGPRECDAHTCTTAVNAIRNIHTFMCEVHTCPETVWCVHKRLNHTYVPLAHLMDTVGTYQWRCALNQTQTLRPFAVFITTRSVISTKFDLYAPHNVVRYR